MKIKEILDRCHQADVELTIADDGEHFWATPVEHLTDNLIEILRQHKTGLLLWLKMEPEKWETIHCENGQIEFFRSGDGDSGDNNSLKPEENGIYVTSPLKKDANFDDLPELKFCPKCGGWQWWQSLAKTWRCQTCDPPSNHAKRFALRAALIRERTKTNNWQRLLWEK